MACVPSNNIFLPYVDTWKDEMERQEDILKQAFRTLDGLYVDVVVHLFLY